jgi:ABC-2 type transport system ATP-binding protein
MDAGRVLEQGTPAEIRRRARPTSGRAPTMEDAFIAIVEAARRRTSARETSSGGAA